jgi:F0F1-type ATP synthase membrane subunit b/b'
MPNDSDARIGDIDKARLLGVIDGLHATIEGLSDANKQLAEANKQLAETNRLLVRSMAEVHRISESAKTPSQETPINQQPKAA